MTQSNVEFVPRTIKYAHTTYISFIYVHVSNAHTHTVEDNTLSAALTPHHRNKEEKKTRTPQTLAPPIRTRTLSYFSKLTISKKISFIYQKLVASAKRTTTKKRKQIEKIHYTTKNFENGKKKYNKSFFPHTHTDAFQHGFISMYRENKKNRTHIYTSTLYHTQVLCIQEKKDRSRKIYENMVCIK